MNDEQPPAPVSVRTFLIDDPAHGPLPILLLLLTAMSGVIDAVSILGLGRVFVANMTGNIVFIGFALVGVPGFALAASVAALAGFLLGASVGGVLVARFGGHRGRLLRNACSAEFVLVGIALVITIPLPPEPGDTTAVVIAALCAVAMGIQNSAARHLAVPDLTTTVLTMTLTGLAADTRRSRKTTTVRRALAVLTMFAGAVVGALLVMHTRLTWALALAVVILGVVVIVSAVRSTQPAPWQTRPA